MSQEKNIRIQRGLVVSNAMDKTVVVTISRRIKHPVYGKYLTRTTKIHAHDENNQCQVGDFVIIRDSRPISKTKSWVVEKIEGGN